MKKYITKAIVVLNLVLGGAISAEPQEANNPIQLTVNNEVLVFHHDGTLKSGKVGVHILSGSKTVQGNAFSFTSGECRMVAKSLRGAISARNNTPDILSCVFYANTSFGIDALRGDLN